MGRVENRFHECPPYTESYVLLQEMTAVETYLKLKRPVRALPSMVCKVLNAPPICPFFIFLSSDTFFYLWGYTHACLCEWWVKAEIASLMGRRIKIHLKRNWHKVTMGASSISIELPLVQGIIDEVIRHFGYEAFRRTMFIIMYSHTMIILLLFNSDIWHEQLNS